MDRKSVVSRAAEKCTRRLHLVARPKQRDGVAGSVCDTVSVMTWFNKSSHPEHILSKNSSTPSLLC